MGARWESDLPLAAGDGKALLTHYGRSWTVILNAEKQTVVRWCHSIEKLVP